ncbi:MAG: hypothetical protein AD742_08615 [Methylibium sp. NZG]|nr:MAG: hypothetical protein AD742_08615 [Methylibium sp. NZG]
MSVAARRSKSKLVATWAALIGGSLGLHRFYLHGWRDVWGWCCIPPTLLGFIGLQRARQIGLDDHLSWLLLPLLGVTLSAAMLTAIVYGLTPDDRWNARFNPTGPASRTGWLTVIAVILALALGSATLMATVAFSAQRFFEYQTEQATPTGR